MKILLLCEPRSGSTSLANWFIENRNFDVRFETAMNDSNDWVGVGINNIIQRPDCRHLVLKEVYYGRMSEHVIDWVQYLDFCDKIVFLYRENEQDQIISWNHAQVTGNFCGQYPEGVVEMVKSNAEYLSKLKRRFKEFREEHKDRGLTISYEDLYMRNKIHILIEYLNLSDELTYKFPLGQRYRYSFDRKNIKDLI